MSKPPSAPYPPDPDPDAGARGVTAFGDLVDAVATDLDWAGERGLGISLQRSWLRRVRLTGAELGEGTFADVTFDECRLDVTGFRHARLERVAFRDCGMGECDFSGATLTDVLFERCDLSRASFPSARLQRVELRSCDLTGLEGAEVLRGVRMPWNDVLENAVLFASLAGVVILVEDD
jgi:uncharacterized protein YjbI with pentapeptide repeats